MKKEIENHKLEIMLEDFMREFPMGDSRDLAKYFYERGYADAERGYTDVENAEDAREVYVRWDVSDNDFETFADGGVPHRVWVPTSIDEEDISDWLSDEYGYCVESWFFMDEI